MIPGAYGMYGLLREWEGILGRVRDAKEEDLVPPTGSDEESS